MPASIVFFPVDNGDMTLITLADGRTILVDINIRQDADNPLTFINHVIRIGYTIMSIDDIPFSEWSTQHPEFFI